MVEPYSSATIWLVDVLVEHLGLQPGLQVSPSQDDLFTKTSPSKKSALKLKNKSHVTSVKSSLSDSPVELEGWVHLWENPNGIPSADLSWVKDDTERGLFSPTPVYRDNTGALKRRRVLKSDRMWFYPPEPSGYVCGTVPTPHLFLRRSIFVWWPFGVWRYSLRCLCGDKCVGNGKHFYLYKSGYLSRVRHSCDVSSWYTMLMEVLCCGQCTKAARSGEGSLGPCYPWSTR
ncbi:uncharacterized protein LOC127624441 isoform X3 [Xyrauchen texanus]|uniref:uncharacterized protein LOC127624441 isoform X3 n=1 Tax=Xyrauchen texanus TaxID=154827 RepID=UPI0022425CCC|nr:uncharacterized protein LOC127624441 isoform X3 [Xyrauchen texanus]